MNLDVVGFILRKHSAYSRLIAKQQTATINRSVKPFMWIEGNGICPVKAGEERTLTFVKCAQGPVCAIDVKPKSKLRGHLGDFIQRINGSRVHSARAGDNAERFSAAPQIVTNRLPQIRHAHAKVFVCFD